MFGEAIKITKKLGKMSKQELENYRKAYSLDPENQSNHEDDGNKAESTACCGHSKKKKKPLTIEEEQEMVQKEFLENQNKIKENNTKSTAVGWIIP